MNRSRRLSLYFRRKVNGKKNRTDKDITVYDRKK